MKKLWRENYLREYNIWRGMISRCTDPRKKDFAYYGAKGIKVWARWGNFENFIKDMGACPPNFSIDRKDSAGNYVPANCRWASQDTQANNKSSSVFLEFNGEKKTATQWAKQLGVTDGAINKRIAKGMSVTQVLTTPFRKKKICL